jgi:prophage regulatory protein
MSNGSYPGSLRILRRREVQHRLGIARSTLYAYLDKKSPQYKPNFPRPIRMGVITGFIEQEIDDYVISLMMSR